MTLHSQLPFVGSLAIILCLLAGCATAPTSQIVSRVETVPAVRIPVLVPCIEADQIPPVPPTRMDPDKQSTWQLVIAVRLDMLDWEGYAVRTQSLLHGCAKALAAEPK